MGFLFSKYYFFVLLFIGFAARSQHSDTIQYDRFKYDIEFVNKDKDLKLWNEAPPVILPQHKGSLYISTTFFSTVWNHQQNLAIPANDKIKISKREKSPRFYATSSSHWWQRFYDPAFLSSSKHVYQDAWQKHYWRRNYNGIFSAHIIKAQNGKNIVFALSHGENKNERIGDFLYQNTVRPTFKIDISDPNTYSGGTPYKDCWEAYFGFLNGNWASLEKDLSITAQYFNDIGPVAWPSAGYVSVDGEQLSQGLRHPSSIIHDGYIYIFVVDASMDGTGGVKLIRVKLEDATLPQRYQTWSGNNWIGALPEGYSKTKTKNYFAVRGPANAPIIPNDKSIIRFTVAKFKQTDNEFIAVEESINQDNTIEVAFRYSNNLINWSERKVVYTDLNWSSSVLRYPVFLNTDGLTDGSIDKEEFYVIGTRDDGNVTKLHFVKQKNKLPDTEDTNTNPDASSQNSRITKTLATSGNTSNSSFSQVIVSPVPAVSFVDVVFNINSISRIYFNLYALNGAPVGSILEETFLPQQAKRTIDFSSLKPGVYVLEVTDNKKSVFKKIVKL
ncbi:T9SS type A sorting domain-containing protein [Pontibacter sp. H249]|uniref:T9SS type A sorting domain-containing protein n=1 Tax=Pontibacter sp. H249 TaxID=3133420 RepID=UPI0030C1FA71